MVFRLSWDKDVSLFNQAISTENKLNNILLYCFLLFIIDIFFFPNY